MPTTRTFWTILVLTALALAGIAISAPAAAAPPDDSEYSDEQRAEAAKEAANATAQEVCGLIIKSSPPLKLVEARAKKGCASALLPVFSHIDEIDSLTAEVICAKVPGTGFRIPGTNRTTPSLHGVCTDWVAGNLPSVRETFWSAYAKALEAVEAAANVAGNVVEFVTNPTGILDHFLNDMKKKAVELFAGVVKEATSATEFDPSQGWWREAYMATGGIGLVLLAISLMVSAWQYSQGVIGPDQAGRAFGLYPLIAVVMMCMGPAVAYALQQAASEMSKGIIGWMGQDTTDFLTEGAFFTSLTATDLGLSGGFIMFVLLTLVALGVLGTFVVQMISTYILGAVSAAAWGMSANPKWRSKALAVPATAAALIFARPAMLLALGLVFKFLKAEGEKMEDTKHGALVFTNGDMIQSWTAALIVFVALAMVAFAPWTLLRWMPLAMDAADSVRSSGPVGTEAAVGAGGSVATSMAIMRSRSHATSGASAGRPPAGRPPPGQAGAGAGQGGAAVGRTAGAAGKTAGTAGKTAGSAAGGVATGGALLAAQLAAAAAQAAVRKTRAAAEAATPNVKEGYQ